MAPYVTSITVDNVIKALGGFLAPFCSGAQIVRAQQNRVAPPPNAYVLLTEISQAEIETPIANFNVPNDQTDIEGRTQIGVQVDFYGPIAGDQAKAVVTVYRSEYAPAQFPDGIKPLYCSEAHQGPLITGEEQYLQRWTLTAFLQYNPVVSIPQQSANALSVNILEDLP